ncbi:hypothetical protein CRU87_07950 [Aliarcobacter trophiarum LMG 25534]|uniref:Zinc-dependent peptidase, M78 family (DUF955 domain) n=1 Tax=Aliarcobacter trophiarum LMG 25534 TaxID=1032241 RepID=A0AAD0VM34_9BACT|nr:ImmA/IrrE family metallo-endopeptidase [Aliarcobacter trophiarum]AXK48465.1 zinc-dependent peptidase, M78 family (DUF955 domain) [Aliarcobacter trophiarum LMG 25534]RXJ90004.1 hypothetical protein CRU87_07950 [Aliarcobacter trophiarum LMG 25534]
MEKKYTTFLNKTTSAYDLLKYLGSQSDFSLKLPIDIEGIIKYLNIKLSKNPNFKKIKLDGMITVKNQEPEIWINPMKTQFEERIRFTLAHELGHFMLHIAPDNNLGKDISIEDNEVSYNRDDNWNHIEMEANNFASQLLMPSSMIIEETKKTLQENPNLSKDEIVEKLASIFAVSNLAMKYRLKKMGVNI